MEGQQAPQPDNIEILMKQLQQIQVKQELMEKQLASKQKKEAEQSFARTWEETTTPETHDPIARVIAKLEKPKQDAVTLTLGVEKDGEGVGKGGGHENVGKKLTFNLITELFLGKPQTFRKAITWEKI